MGFAEPVWLLLLLPVAMLLAGYVRLLRRRQRDIAWFTAVDLLDTIIPRRTGWRKHLPTAGILLALVLLSVGMAGPTAEGKVPRNRATVMLVIDVSLSMQATDVAPTRLAAAQAAPRRARTGRTNAGDRSPRRRRRPG